MKDPINESQLKKLLEEVILKNDLPYDAESILREIRYLSFDSSKPTYIVRLPDNKIFYIKGYPDKDEIKFDHASFFGGPLVFIR